MNNTLYPLFNSLFIAGQRTINSVLQFVFFLLLIHTLTPEGMGIFELGRACLELGTGMAAPALGLIVVRENSRYRDWWRFHKSQIYTILLIGSYATGLLFFLLISLHSLDWMKSLVVGVFCLTIFFQGACTTYESLFLSLNQVSWFSRVNVLCNGVSTLALALIIWIMPDPLLLATLLLFIRWLANYLIYASRARELYRSEETESLLQSPLSIRGLLWQTWPLAVGSMLFILYARMDTIMLDMFDQEESVAIYSGAYRIIGLISMVFLSIYQAFSPTISRKIAKSYRQAWSFVLWLGVFVGAIGLVLALILQVTGGLLVEFLYPANYQFTQTALQLLSWTLPIIFLGNAFGYFLVNEETRGIYFYVGINLFGVLLNGVGNYLLIPIYSYTGAAWMTVVTDAFTTLLMVVAAGMISFYWSDRPEIVEQR
ncbi:MAG: oligosaccharide flippase family protein [bacterium]|jgi:O-antigen/teichoic acid export membrane protein